MSSQLELLARECEELNRIGAAPSEEPVFDRWQTEPAAC